MAVTQILSPTAGDSVRDLIRKLLNNSAYAIENGVGDGSSSTGTGDFIATVNTEAELAAYTTLPAVGNVVRYLDTSGAWREVRAYEVTTYVDETNVAGEQIRSTATPTKMLKRVVQG